MGIVTALNYLDNPDSFPVQKVTVLYGGETFFISEVIRQLRSLVLSGEDAAFSLTRYNGHHVSWPEVFNEVSTIAMFGGDVRLVIVEQADSLVSQNRESLEQYLNHPSASGILVLQLQTLASNTRLYKQLSKNGLLIDCRPLPDKQIPGWLVRWARQKHQVSLESAAAVMLLEMIGNEPGLLNQEVSRLALMVPAGQAITPALIRANTGNWRAKKVWDMLDSALAGKTADALRQLDLLLAADESPIALLAQIASNLRRLAAATELFLEAEQNGTPARLSDVLEKAGVQAYFIPGTAEQMKHLGRVRGSRLFQWLVNTDLDLKGQSRANPRLILERLLVQISHPKMKHCSGF